MRAFGFQQQRSLHLALAGACALVFAGLTDAVAQFPPPPGQNQSQNQSQNQNRSQSASTNSPFPPPQGQQQNQLQSPFPPAPGAQANTPAFGGAPPPAPGGFGVRPGGFSGGPAQGSFSGPAPGGFGGPPQAGPSEEQKVCLTFPSIRDDVEKGAAGIRSAGERKAAREEVCPLFKSFAVKEAKLVKFLETNQKLCGVPPNVITQVKQNHAKTIQIRNTVCSAAPAAAAGPSLSDALGGPIIADDTSTRSGRGVFDTLTGNALQR
jgi:hypothetical protein